MEYTAELGPQGHPLLPLNKASLKAKFTTLRTKDGNVSVGGKLTNARTDILVSEQASKKFWNIVSL